MNKSNKANPILDMDEKLTTQHSSMIVDRKLSRLKLLIKAVAEEGPIHLGRAASILGVSEMTIRRDVAESGGSLGYLGGFVVPGNVVNAKTDYNMSQENVRHAALKEEACARAVGLIERDDVVFIDCGTTTPYLAGILPENMNLTIVCYSLNIAEIVCRKIKARVLLLGGIYEPGSETFAGEGSLSLLEQIGISKAFYSAGGIHLSHGVSCSHFHEVTIKRAVLDKAAQNYLVVDSSKFNRVKLAVFAHINQFQGIITDSSISPGDLETFQSCGVPLIHNG
ncbi:MAG: DeoR/GlpR family DNA-binding transcription regulator [Methylobacteriaceae bacterium]|nr:DeoR/GlpR family DNA-binding transcription regulator [Methylobacteriaceae bacterium]